MFSELRKIVNAMADAEIPEWLIPDLIEDMLERIEDVGAWEPEELEDAWDYFERELFCSPQR